MQVLFWYWWILAGLLLALELAWSQYVFLWLGFAAAAVGFLLLVFPSTPLRAQLVVFVLLSVVAISAWRYYRHTPPQQSD